MQTNFSAAQLADPAIAAANGIIQTCNHFGFCTATCPTYALTHHENESPRGRIDLIRSMLETGGPPAAQTVRHLDSCLSCLACMSTCAVKVDYMHLIDQAREYVERHFQRPWKDRALRSLIATTVTHRHRFRVVLALGRLTGRLPGSLMHRVPGRLAGMLQLVPPIPKRRTPDVRAQTYPAQGGRRWRVALLAGCAQRVLAPQINAATVRLLTRLGCDVVVVPGVECCGALELHMGRAAQARHVAKRNVGAWAAEAERAALDAIIVNASGCGTTVKDYDHLLGHDAGLRDSTRRVASLAVDVCEFVDRIGLGTPPVPRRCRVAYHDACSLRNGQRITREPRRLLRDAGYAVVDVPESHFCCGSAGAYNLLQPQVARQLGERKARHVQSTQADVLAVGNIGCITQLSRLMAMPVVHTVELLDWATGGPAPDSLDHHPRRDERAAPVASTVPSIDAPPARPSEAPTGVGVW